MTRLSELTSEERIETYRDLGLEAVRKARATSGRDASLYLNLAAQWMQLADTVASRIKAEEMNRDDQSS